MTKTDREYMKRKGIREQKSRARKAVTILNKHYDRNDHETCVVDMLTDLRHLCDVKGIDFYGCYASSARHYRAEKRGED